MNAVVPAASGVVSTEGAGTPCGSRHSNRAWLLVRLALESLEAENSAAATSSNDLGHLPEAEICAQLETFLQRFEACVEQPGDYQVLVVDDHHMLRLGLKALSLASGELRLDWMEAGNLGDALTVFRQHQGIDLVLLDLNLPDSKGLHGVRRFLGEYPQAQVAVFSATEDEFVVRQAFALGAVGFIPKSSSGQATLRLIESLLVGASVNEARTSGPAPLESGEAHGGVSGRSLHERTAMLNPTQLRVLELVLAGMSNQEIAQECHLALGTVKNTVSSIMLSLDVHSRSHLISVF
jgi:DNA-binding NarL/FixJ family response regulator